MDNQQILKHLDDIWTFGHEPTDEEREAVRAAMDIIEEYIKTGGWIPCSERLPEESLNSVIGWDEYRRRCCFVQYLGGRWILGNDVDSVKIVAWQPLPEAYHG